MQKDFKVAMKIAYYGVAFFGFQRQNEVLSVSDFLSEKFRSVGIFGEFLASGRTDRGVHASAQVISLNVPHFWDNLEELKTRLNKKLYPYVKIKRIWRVSDEFNARFHAKRRGYCYLLSKQNSPFLNTISLPYLPQNPNLIRLALKELEGQHNFSAFCKSDGCGEKGAIRTIFKARLKEYGGFYIFSFWGSGFLRSQIRLMVGILLEIDKGNLSIDDLKRQLQGEKIYRIPIAPHGLFLTRVDY